MFGQRHGRWMIVLVTVLAIVGVALHGPIPVAAQDDPTSDVNFKDLEGFQRGAGRVWMGDITALMGGLEAYATPGAEVSTPDFSKLGLFMMVGMVAQFDNDDHAGSAFGTLADQITTSMASDESGITLKEADGEKFGDQSRTYTGAMSEDSMEGQLTMVVVQKGEFIYASFGMGLGSDPSDAVNSLMKDMTGNKPGNGDGTFNDDGTSTGGLWDVFPTDAEYLKGLTPMSDEDLSQDAES